MLIDSFIDFSGESSVSSSSQSSSSSSTTSSRSSLRARAGWFWFSLSYKRVATKVNRQSSSSSTSKSESQWRTLVSTMRIERYYSSVREEVSPLTPSAKSILEREDYVGFFKACGPNYTRGIRRTQEVTAIFQYQSSSVETSRQYASAVQRRKDTKSWSLRIGRGGGFRRSSRTETSSNSYGSKSKFKAINNSLRITIIGFGLGLSQEGSDTMVATTMQQHDQVMNFAFNAMTRNQDAHHVGMVYGIEIVPWVHNIAFQAAANIGEAVVEIPMPRSIIPKAVSGVCENPNFLKDKYGYCCELEQLFNSTSQEYTGVGADPTTHVCKPIHALHPAIIKDNMSNNGEFVARLDSALRYRMTALGALEKCISAANSIPESQYTNILKTQDSVKYDGLIETSISVAELIMTIDPGRDYGVMKLMAIELEEWIDMYMEPCYAAIFGTNIGSTPDVDVTYFMAYSWHHHKECMNLSCITNNMRWDRANGGCVPSVTTGRNAQAYTGTTTHCSTQIDKYERVQCKHDDGTISADLTKYQTCWTNNGIGNLDHMINYFCLPQVTTTKSTKSNLVANLNACK